MDIVFLDDDSSINFYHQIIFEDLINSEEHSILFKNEPVSYLAELNATANKPDLIFLDINMPLMDGWEFLDSFTDSFPNAKTVFILVSSSMHPAHKQKAEDHPLIKDFAEKPLDLKYVTNNILSGKLYQ